MDIDGDGAKNGLIVGGAKSTLGSSTVQGPAGEFVFSGPATCPNGNAGFNFTQAPGTAGQVFRFDSTGDLLIEEDTSGTLCFDPTTELFLFTGTGAITGGTGRFDGATGSFEYNCTSEILFGPDTEGNALGHVTCEFTGTIIPTK